MEYELYTRPTARRKRGYWVAHCFVISSSAGLMWAITSRIEIVLMAWFIFSLQFFSLKPLPPNPTSNHSAAKQPAFSPSLPEHVYQNCFGGAGGAGDWNSSLQCLSLKFENLWDAAVMKSWNPSVLLPESLPGEPLWRSRDDRRISSRKS